MDWQGVLGLVTALFSVLVVVIGWSVTAGIQRTILLQTLKNQARVEISYALREYARAVGSVDSAFRALPMRFTMERDFGLKVDWVDLMRSLGDALKVPLEWIFLLEEHEALFPYTGQCRKDLVRRHSRITRPLYDCVSSIGNPVARQSAILAVQSHLDDLIDQQALVTDLQVELQNDCFAPLAGTRAISRVPKDPQLPRLKRNSRGELQIVPAEPDLEGQENQTCATAAPG